MANMKITKIAQYRAIEKYLNAKLGINEDELIELLAEGEGPEIGLTDDGVAWALWPPCANDKGDRRAIFPSSAGGLIDRSHPATSIIKSLIEG